MMEKRFRNFKPAEAYVSVSGIVRLSDDLFGVVSDGFLYYFNRKLETFLPKCVDSAISTGVTHVLVADDSSYWGISGSRLILYQWEIEQGEGRGRICCSGKHTKGVSVIRGKNGALFFYLLS